MIYHDSLILANRSVYSAKLQKTLNIMSLLFFCSNSVWMCSATSLNSKLSHNVLFYSYVLSLCLPHSSFVQYRWRQWKPHRPGPQVSVSLIVTYSIMEQVIYHSLPASPPLPSLPPGWMMLSELVTSTSILCVCVCVCVCVYVWLC